MKWLYTINRFRDLFWRILLVIFSFIIYEIILATIVKSETEGQFANLDMIIFAIAVFLILFFICSYIYTRFIKKV